MVCKRCVCPWSACIESFNAHFNIETNFFVFYMQVFDMAYLTLVAEFNEEEALKKSSK